jgi:DNA-binding IclR family transcriptional regulator
MEQQVDSKDRSFVSSLARGFEVLQAFSPSQVTMSAGDLARSTGFPKATITRFTHTLVKLGYLIFREDIGHYQLHPKILTLGYPVLATVERRHVAAPLMQALADYSGGTVSLGIRADLSIILIERSRSKTVRALPLDIGSRLPLASTAIGRAYFAAAEEKEREIILKLYQDRHPDKFDVTHKMLSQSVVEYRQKGYCKAIGSWEHDVCAVGAAVRLSSETLAAFNCGGPESRLPLDRLDDFGDRLSQLAHDFQTSEWIGQLPPRREREGVQ